MTADLSGKTVAFLVAAEGIEQVELTSPWQAVVDAGARLQGISNSGINYLALPTHLEPFFRGLLASVDIVYFGLVAGVALALASHRIDTLRSRPD